MGKNNGRSALPLTGRSSVAHGPHIAACPDKAGGDCGRRGSVSLSRGDLSVSWALRSGNTLFCKSYLPVLALRLLG